MDEAGKNLDLAEKALSGVVIAFEGIGKDLHRLDAVGNGVADAIDHFFPGALDYVKDFVIAQTGLSLEHARIPYILFRASMPGKAIGGIAEKP